MLIDIVSSLRVFQPPYFQRPKVALVICAALIFSMLCYGFRASSPLHVHRRGVVLVTGLTFEKLQDFDGVDDFYSKLWNNRLTYANAHGYELMLVDFKEFQVAKTLNPVWAKIPAILKALEQHPAAEWVWWLDSDAIIMTPTLKARLLEGKVLHPNDRVPLTPKGSIKTEMNLDPSKVDIICVEDKHGLNAGSMFFRNTDAIRLFVDMWSDPILIQFAEKKFRLKEQDLLLHLIMEHPKLRERVGLVNQRVINAYQVMDNQKVRWHPGDLIVHFPNCFLHRDCSELWRNHWPEREIIKLERTQKPPPPLLIKTLKES